MQQKKYDEKSYRIHTIKTNRYKTTRIEVVLRKKIKDISLAPYSFLSSMLNESSKKYPSRRMVAIKNEELYKTYYFASANRIGNCLNFTFNIDFINPEYVKDNNYLKDVVSFLFEMMTNPNVKNGEFDNNSFNIVKNEMIVDVQSIDENPHQKAINESLKALDKESISALNLLGTKEEILKITPDNLYKTYIDLMNTSLVDIFIIGNTNMDNIIKEIKKAYHNHHMRFDNIDYYIENKERRKPITKKDKSSFMQSQLVMLFNLNKLTKNEKEVAFHLYNYILGSGGLTSKLYKYVREESGLCYQIGSMYFKYDNLLCIDSSLAYNNVQKAVDLIRKALLEMKNGKFTIDEIKDAKKNMHSSLVMNRNNPAVILANYEFKEFLGNYTLDEKLELLDKITKKDIVNVAKKVKLNTIYILCEDNHEGN